MENDGVQFCNLAEDKIKVMAKDFSMGRMTVFMAKRIVEETSGFSEMKFLTRGLWSKDF